ncbi:pheromone A receptor-domain-containing protein [Mycena amicta]|nr:pheromone A receptor-domain-containing protein [Mycena amicta]
MLDLTYPLFPICAFLGFVMVLVPLPWHLHAWNSGTCFYMMWSSLACLNLFINSVVWADDVINKAPIWCDISIRIIMGSSVGIPAASLCINRRLYKIARVQAVSVSPSEKRRAILIDTVICVIFPITYVALQYVVQGHRFNLFEQIGPQPALFNTPPMYFITMMWPPLIGCVSATFGVLSLREFFRRRASFAQFLSPSGTSSSHGLTTARYLRLMALAAMDIIITTPLGILTIYMNLTGTPVQPWESWANTHLMFSRVEQFPAFLWRLEPLLVRGIEFTRWVAPASAFIFFAFFGFASEARKNYANAFRALVALFWRCLARCGIHRPTRGFFALSSAPSGNKPSVKPTARPSFVGSLSPSKLPPIRHSALAISLPLPLYSTTGSFTEVSSSASPCTSEFTDLKRAASFASTSVSTTRATLGYVYDGEDGRQSRFVEHLGEVYDLEKGATPEDDIHRDEHPNYYHAEPQPQHHTDVQTPSSSTSFAPTSPSATSTSSHDQSPPVTPNYALPLHLAWAARPYPAVYNHATTASSMVEPEAETEGRERDSWSPASEAGDDVQSMRMEVVRPASAGSAGRGRTLV